jgi:hypothetical protein
MHSADSEPKTKMETELKQAGFTKELIMWSFTPMFYKQADGYYWSKEVPYEKGYTDRIEIGVILNEEYKSMEVYACDCVVGCCGRDMGIHPFSIDKVNSLLADEVKWLDEIYGT